MVNMLHSNNVVMLHFKIPIILYSCEVRSVLKNKKLYQPKQLSEKLRKKLSTLHGYLANRKAFPPVKIDKNSKYRYYDDKIVERLQIAFSLMDDLRLTKYEIFEIFEEANDDTISELKSKSVEEVFAYIKSTKKK